MPDSIPQHHVQQYKGNVMHLAQQKGSRLRRSVRTDGDIVGDTVYFDRLGQSEAQEITTRHGDTPLNDVEHSRRAAVMRDYDWATLVDKTDKLKTLYDPTNPYARTGSWAHGRKMDDIVIDALGGTAATGKLGGSSVALPSAQKITVDDHTYDSGSGDVGLTLSKLILAREILLAAEVDEDQTFYMVTTRKQISNLLTETELTSADYNTVKALVKGEINSFMGFEFLRTERLNTDASSDRLCYAYTGMAVGLGLPKDITVDIGPRRDKRNSTQIYTCMSLGAVRVEEEQVVEVACSE